MTTREKADAAMQTRATQAKDRRMAMRRQGYPGQRAVCGAGGITRATLIVPRKASGGRKAMRLCDV